MKEKILVRYPDDLDLSAPVSGDALENIEYLTPFAGWRYIVSFAEYHLMYPYEVYFTKEGCVFSTMGKSIGIYLNEKDKTIMPFDHGCGEKPTGKLIWKYNFQREYRNICTVKDFIEASQNFLEYANNEMWFNLEMNKRVESVLRGVEFTCTLPKKYFW